MLGLLAVAQNGQFERPEASGQLAARLLREIKVVQEELGHSLLSSSTDTYGHLFPEALDQAADAMGRALTG